MGIWEDEWMHFIGGLNQSEANQTVLRSVNYYRNHYYPSKEARFSQPPTGVYPYTSKLTVLNLYSGQQAVLLLCPSASCQLLTTLYLYSSQYCLFALLFLLLGYLALVVLCMLACRYFYNLCFGGGKGGKGDKSGSTTSYEQRGRCPHCDGQRDIIIQVNQNRLPSPPVAAGQPPPLPPPRNDDKAPNVAVDKFLNKAENKQPLNEHFHSEPVFVVENGKDADNDNVEQLAMHLASHLALVESIYERKQYRLLQDEIQVPSFEPITTSSAYASSSQTNSDGDSQSIYLSDLNPGTGSLNTTTTATTTSFSISMGTPQSSKVEEEDEAEKDSITCIPFANHNQHFPNESGEGGNEELEFKTAEEQLAAESEQLEHSPSPVPSPSHEVPHCMMINRFAHKISQAGEEEVEVQQKKGEEQIFQSQLI